MITSVDRKRKRGIKKISVCVCVSVFFFKDGLANGVKSYKTKFDVNVCLAAIKMQSTFIKV